MDGLAVIWQFQSIVLPSSTDKDPVLLHVALSAGVLQTAVDVYTLQHYKHYYDYV